MPDSQDSPPRDDNPSPSNTSRAPTANERGNDDGPEVDSFDNPGLAAQNGRGSMSSFLIMTLMLYMFTSINGEDLVVLSQYRESLKSLRFQQANFSAWLWSGGNSGVNSSAGMNFTLPETDDSSIAFAHAVMGFGVPLHPSTSSYYTNITGFVHGPVEMHNLTLDYTGSSKSPAELDASGASNSEVTLSVTSKIDSLPPWAGVASEFIKGINMSDARERIGTWNWSAPTELAFRVIEKRPVLRPVRGSWGKATGGDDLLRMNELLWSDISLMHGRMELTDRATGDELAFDMEAVHFIENGTIYGLADASGRHVDVREIPSLVPVPFVNATAQAVNAELLARIQKLQDMIDSGTIEIDAQSSDEAPKSTCPFIIFAQLVPTPVPKELMEELESEMENPTGISTVARPELMINAVLMSKECGIMLEMRSAEGLKSQRFWRKVTTYSALAAIVYLALLLLLIRQTGVSQTPAGISRVSRWTFLTQAAADSISFVGHITFGILTDGRPSMSLIAPAFLAAVLLAYEAQFSGLVHQIQEPQDNVMVQPRQPSQATPPDQNTPTSTSSMTLPSTSRDESNAGPEPQQGAPPAPSAVPSLSSIIRESSAATWRRIRESPQARFWLSMTLALTLFVRVLMSPSLALFAIAAVYGNIWIPQIVRSVRRGTTSGLRFEYLFGTTLCRSFFALYLFACPKNVLGIDTSPWILILVAFILLQVIVILLQDYLGPGFFMPRSYTPPTQYDYHPYIPVPDDEAPEPTLGDCAICMDAIVVQSGAQSGRRSISEKTERRSSSSIKEREREKERERGVRGILDRIEVATGRSTGVSVGLGGSGARRSYALAPCHHLFHTACLEQWLAIKNICPQCRRPLPPL